VDELQHDVRVSLGYADPAKNVYIAISGSGTLFRDVQKATQLWSFEQRAYYPHGPADERLAVLRVLIERAEILDCSRTASYLLSAVKAAVTGIPVDVIVRITRSSER